MRIDLHDNEEPEIGLIALIDCIFFLLMFFMVATSFTQQVGKHEERHLPIMLPKAEISLNRADAAPVEPLVIGVDAEGRFTVDGRFASVQTLHDRLRAEARADLSRAVRIDGDKRVSFQHIVHVLDLCAVEGLTRISVRTRQ